MAFDRALMTEPDTNISVMAGNLSLRLYDAVIGNGQAERKGWTPLERASNQHMGWYPWGTLKKHLENPN
eukprot:2429481-Heterocapsa_arctica.AAC.1